MGEKKISSKLGREGTFFFFGRLKRYPVHLSTLWFPYDERLSIKLMGSLVGNENEKKKYVIISSMQKVQTFH